MKNLFESQNEEMKENRDREDARKAGNEATTSSVFEKNVGLLGKFAAFSIAKKVSIVLLATAILGGSIVGCNSVTRDASSVTESQKESQKPTSVKTPTEPAIPTSAETPKSTETVVPTVTPSITPTAEDPIIGSSTDKQDGIYTRSLREYYEVLGKLARNRATTAKIYSPSALSYHIDYFNDVAELQRYAGINVALHAEYSSLDENGWELETVDGNVIINVTLTYGENEIAAYSEEDYWDKYTKAIQKRLECFTIYMSGDDLYDLTEISSRYLEYEYPPQELHEKAVVYDTETRSHGVSLSDGSIALGIDTYYVNYLDNNDIFVDKIDQMIPTLRAWYENGREAGVTLHYNDNVVIEYEEEKNAIVEWFRTTYPDSGYYLDFKEYEDVTPPFAGYFTCTPRKQGEDASAPSPEDFPPIDESISLAPSTTPIPVEERGTAPEQLPDTGHINAEELANSIIAEIITPTMSEVEKVKAIHDYMIMNIDEYRILNEEKQFYTPAEYNTPEAALGLGYTGNHGYALTFQLLCRIAGLESTVVEGRTSIYPISWNQVCVDGNWYHIDVCGDDPWIVEKKHNDHSFNTYRYFLFSDEDKNRTSYVANDLYSCTAPSVMFQATKYGCPWKSVIWNPSTDELTEAVKQTVQNGQSEMDIILPYSISVRDFSDEYWDLIQQSLSDCFYSPEIRLAAEEIMINSTQGIKYTLVTVSFHTLRGELVSYPLVESAEQIHSIVDNAIKEGKRFVFVYASSEKFVKTCMSDYANPSDYRIVVYNPFHLEGDYIPVKINFDER